ncbi:hypothetical protein [Aureivirga sp. CE67]|uniref:hypothetical protein n=1 Tax=Aureivirga sp. CE67 TaxID=1788983 RepID=UPI0018C91C14|nr:hypothetical protein [Aureivirga sp. CE67]
MKNKLLLLLLFCSILTSSCDSPKINSGVTYLTHENPKKHIINFGEFSLVTPKEYKHKKVNGIDSWVGEIRYKDSYLIFDYGMYSHSGFISKKELFKKWETELKFENLIEFRRILMEENIDKNTEAPTIKNLKENIEKLELREMNDSVKYYYNITYKGKEYNLPLLINEAEKQTYLYCKQKVDTVDNNIRIIKTWKEIENPSSVELVPIDKKQFGSTLWLGMMNQGDLTDEEVMEILHSLKWKKIEKRIEIAN